MRSFVYVFLLVLPKLITAQKLPEIDALNRVILNHKDSIIYAHLMPSEDSRKITASDRYWYNWYAQHDIKETKGGFDGKLLHGMYTEYYDTKDLKKKGNFKKGLKSGKWKSWHRNGQLSEIANYKNGLRQGKSIFYNNTGALISVQKYKKGVLQVKKEKASKKREPKDTTSSDINSKKKGKIKKEEKESGKKSKAGKKEDKKNSPIAPEGENQEIRKGKKRKEKSPEIRIRRGIKIVPQPGKST